MVDEIGTWSSGLETLLARIGPVFANRRGRDRVARYVRGLLSNVERKNGWQLAEQAGETTPYAMQQFLYRGEWKPDELSREARRYAMEAVGDVDGVFVGDETGIEKKGTHSVGVQRQYSGAAGRVENCQIAVLLGYVSRRGRVLLDRELYLPESWTDDTERCAAAGVPDTVVFRTKPAQLRVMLERSLTEGAKASWVTADTVYGNDPDTRTWLEGRKLGYVLATSVNDARVQINLSTLRAIKDVVAGLPEHSWQRLSAGDGTKGARWYDWQRVELATIPCMGWRYALLMQRSITDPTVVKVHRCFYPERTPLATLVAVAGCRWTIETDIEEAKGEVGLDHYEVRSWGGWYRHVSLALLAHTFLAVMKAAGDAAEVAQKGGPSHQTPTSMSAFKASRGLLSA